MIKVRQEEMLWDTETIIFRQGRKIINLDSYTIQNNQPSWTITFIPGKLIGSPGKTFMI